MKSRFSLVSLSTSRRSAVSSLLPIAAGALAAAIACGVALAAFASPLNAQETASGVTAENVEGATHFRRLSTTVACGGATTPAAVAQIKKMGFVSDINLRRASEPGANIKDEAAAAKAAGLRYYHVPFDGEHPTDAAVDKFLAVITAPGNEPAYIHCSGGNRASTMWFIKRMVVDHWSEERAFTEATELGMTSPALKRFAIDYARKHANPE